MAYIELADVVQARERIADHIHITPVMSSALLNEQLGAQFFFKCEQLQKEGAFKARGATNAVYSLAPEELALGVATHSSGNHAAALARAASQRGGRATIVMPSNAPAVKRAAVASYNGEIIECEPTLAAREETLREYIEKTGAIPVHPYANPLVVAGQGTVALELLEQVDELDMVVMPVGGGGLMAGMATVIKALSPTIEVMAAEPAGADDAFRSFGLGELVAQTNPQTIADGLRASLGADNYKIARERVDTIVTVEDETTIAAMRLLWSRLKQVVEPSGAVSFGAALEHAERFRGRRVGVVLSGGNLDLDQLPF